MRGLCWAAQQQPAGCRARQPATLQNPSLCSSSSIQRPRAAARISRGRSAIIVRSAAEEDLELQEQAYVPPQQPELWDRSQYMGDNSYAMNNKYNQEPDFLDPEWHTKVTDWSDFWNNQKWDLEVEGLDDEHDVGGNSLSSAERAAALFAAIKDNRLRGDVMQWMPPANFREHFTAWENPPVEPDKVEPNPAYTHNDLRAISEKRRWKDIMDTEWRRRQGLVGRLQYPDPYMDTRLDRFSHEVRDMHWSAERIRNLITMDGLGAPPEAHEAWVENPLVPVDYVQKMGVFWVEETEDFLASIGHLAMPEDEARFDEEVVLGALHLLGLNEGDLLEEALAMEDDYEDEEDEDSDCDGEMDEEDMDEYEYDDEDEEGGIVTVEDGDGF